MASYHRFYPPARRLIARGAYGIYGRHNAIDINLLLSDGDMERKANP